MVMAIHAERQWRSDSLHLLLLRAIAVAAAALLHLPTTTSQPSHLHPMVLVPGYATNELDARLTELYRPSSSSPPGCGDRRGKGWFRLYLNHTALLHDPAAVRCFAEQMSSVYDAAAGDYRNVAGVETRAPFFGSIRGFRYPDPDRRSFSYMDRLLTRLERVGYRDGETMFGAPYDFRYGFAPPGHASRVGDAFFRQLKTLVETASRRNAGRPVVIVTHSYGGTLAHQFLLRRPLAWRRRFVRRFVPIATPWGGIVPAMQTLAAGNNLGLPFVDPRALREQYRSLQSSLLFLPSPAVFGEDAPLATTERRNYSAGDMSDFLGAIGLAGAVGAYETRVLPIVREPPPPPRVPVTCIVGVGVETPERLVYPRGPAGEFGATPRVVAGDGDGLVNLASLFAIDRPAWRRHGHLRMVKVAYASHNGILVDDGALDVVVAEIQRVN